MRARVVRVRVARVRVASVRVVRARVSGRVRVRVGAGALRRLALEERVVLLLGDAVVPPRVRVRVRVRVGLGLGLGLR